MFKISRKIILAGAVGNALEMYDFAICGLFALYLAQTFLPAGSNLSDIFLLFFITYFFRPIGSLLFGAFADQLGRKIILKICIFLMGIATIALGMLPSYQQIGVAAVFLLFFIRILQVLSVSGEYVSSVSLLIESCALQQRGYFGSWAAFGVNFGMLVASLTGSVLIYLMDQHLLPMWGWRLAFLLAFFTMVVGFWIRSSIPESWDFINANAISDKKPLFTIFLEGLEFIKANPVKALTVFALVWLGTSITVLIFIYAPNHMTTINTLNRLQALTVNSSSLLLLVTLIPIFGIISDKLGRIVTIASSILALLILVFPYCLIISSGKFYLIFIAHLIVAVPCACIFSVTPVLIAELVPITIRCATIGAIYSIAVILGGGITPLLALKFSKFAYLLSLLLLIPGVVSLFLLNSLKFKKTHLSLIKKLNELQL